MVTRQERGVLQDCDNLPRSHLRSVERRTHCREGTVFTSQKRYKFRCLEMRAGKSRLSLPVTFALCR